VVKFRLKGVEDVESLVAHIAVPNVDFQDLR